MPTRKIADIADAPWFSLCRHPDHNPPNAMVMANGVYEHECQSCGYKQTFIVCRPTLATAVPCRNRLVPEE
jgi:hypothetical protein